MADPSEKTPDKILNYPIPFDLYVQVNAEADRLGISTAGFMRFLAVQYFDKRAQPPTESKTGGEA